MVHNMEKIITLGKQLISIVAFAAVFTSITFAQAIDQDFYNEVDALLKTHVEDGLVDYASLKNNAKLASLIDQVAHADISNLDAKSEQAFFINAYNLNVINQVVNNLPIKSVMEISGFFDKNKITVAQSQMTLNNLEKEKLLKKFEDARYHFVLVCGAIGCPPITNFAYTPDKLESQLEQQTKIALNKPSFIRAMSGSVQLSQIFKWYTSDFGGSQAAVLEYINKYRIHKIENPKSIKYYDYDWSLNTQSNPTGSIDTTSQGSNAFRYIVSSTIPKGEFEIKLFNNLYSQQTGSVNALVDRSSFFTTFLSALYGVGDQINIGLVTRFRKVRNNSLPSSPFSVFGSDEEGSSRSGITAIGPQIRYAPNPNWPNFSIQSSVAFPIGQDLAGNLEQPYIDWNGITWWTQFFNDFSIGSKFSLFTEVDLLIEDIGAPDNNHINRISTPATVIFSYVPTNQLTFYTLAGYSPFWQEEFDYFTQLGIGSKYQFTPDIEVEILYTDFANKSLNNTGGQAETINLGLRFNIR